MVSAMFSKILTLLSAVSGTDISKTHTLSLKFTEGT